MILDSTIADLVCKYGIKEVLAALCRECAKRSMTEKHFAKHGMTEKHFTMLFRKLNRIYEWYALADDKLRDRAIARQRGWKK